MIRRNKWGAIKRLSAIKRLIVAEGAAEKDLNKESNKPKRPRAKNKLSDNFKNLSVRRLQQAA
jgi:hypothetical protein